MIFFYEYDPEFESKEKNKIIRKNLRDESNILELPDKE